MYKTRLVLVLAAQGATLLIGELLKGLETCLEGLGGSSCLFPALSEPQGVHFSNPKSQGVKGPWSSHRRVEGGSPCETRGNRTAAPVDRAREQLVKLMGPRPVLGLWLSVVQRYVLGWGGYWAVP